MGAHTDGGARRYTRRTLLAALGVGTATASLGGVSARSYRQGTEPLPVEWAREYGTEGRYLNVRRAVRTDDGGLVFGGEGVPPGEPTEPQLAVVRTDAAGQVQWRTFVDDGIDRSYQEGRAVLRTTDGGFVVAGYGRHPDEPVTYRSGTRVAEAAKVDPDGTIQWVRTFDAYEPDDVDDETPDPGKEDNAFVFAAAPGSDGGAVVAGLRNAPPWAAKLAADGSVEWELTHPERNAFVGAFPRGDGGFVLVANPEENDPYHALHVSSTGRVERVVPLAVDYDRVTSNHVFVPTADGGYAYTGREYLAQNMVLARLDADGNHRWMRFYDGPGDWTDWAHDLVQTRDGGFVLAGFMSEANGKPRPALVRTDSEGREVWRRVLTERRDIVGDTGFSEVVETDDGFAAIAVPWVVKFGPDATTTTTQSTTTRTTERTPEKTTETATDSPGFGVPSAVGALGLGLSGWLARTWWQDDE